jgi:hypothetical protein
MASTLTTNLVLFKATPNTSEAFRVTDVNSNWDKVDAFAVAPVGIVLDGGTA